MRNAVQRIVCAMLLACAVPISSQAEAASRITFTRKELKALSPQEVATRIFGAVAAKATRVDQIKFAPTPPDTKSSPWLQIVDVYLEPFYEDYSRLCRRDMLQATFEPVHASEAKKHSQGPADYDPPTVLTDIDLTHFFADPGEAAADGKVSCRAKNPDYFIATSGSEATLGFDAYRAFRKEIAKEKPDVPISCVVMKSADPCSDSLAKIATHSASLTSVESVTLGPGPQETVVVLVGARDPADAGTELHLTLSNSELTGIEVIDDVFDPPEFPTKVY